MVEPQPLATQVRELLKEHEVENRAQLVDKLSTIAVDLMEKQYGPESKKFKPYHNQEHVKLVLNYLEKIAKKANISEQDQQLLKLALAWHDIDSETPELAEFKSAEVIALIMQQTGFSGNEIQDVIDIVLATRYYFKDGIMHQSVEPENEEQAADTRIQLLKSIAADADMYNLGVDWILYTQEARKYAQELGKLPRDRQPTIEEERDFWIWQDNFFTGFAKRGYYTEAAKTIYDQFEINRSKVAENRDYFEAQAAEKTGNTKPYRVTISQPSPA